MGKLAELLCACFIISLLVRIPVKSATCPAKSATL